MMTTTTTHMDAVNVLCAECGVGEERGAVRCGHTGGGVETPTRGNSVQKKGTLVEEAGGQMRCQTSAAYIIQATPRYPHTHAAATWHDLTHRHHGTLTTQAEMQQWVAELGNPNHHHRIVLRTEQVVWSTRRSR